MFYRCVIAAVLFMLCIGATPTHGQDSVSQPNGLTIHVVQRGENLYRIALRYSLTVADIVRANGITNPGSIQVGQRLLIPGAVEETTVQNLTHVVRAGETLRSIALLYGTNVDDLATRNQLINANAIYVGQVLVVGPGEMLNAAALAPQPPVLAAEAQPESVPVAEAAPANPPSPVIHIVQRGETLFKIAQSYGLTVNDLVQANGISDPTLIYSGQQLVIPGLEPPHIALDLPAAISSLDVFPQALLQGKTVRVRMTTAAPSAVSATFLGRAVTAISEENGTRHTFLQGIPVFTDAGIYPFDLSIRDNGTGQETPFSVNLQVVGGGYGRENIRLLADRGGLLDPAVEGAEQSMIEQVTGAFNPERYFEGQMGLPAAATVISPFGTLRSYNGGPFDRFHTGTDFAGAPGTPVLAAAAGRVVLADMLNVRGGATIIDHGWGVYTGYWHQAEQYVRPGDIVSAGQVIGTIGATGRVTGAHLHWELWVGGVPVDPMQWVRQPFI